MSTIGFGTTISFSSGFLAKITDVSLSGLSRESIDVTHYGSTDGWMEFVPSSMIDAGELEVEIQFEGASPPITGVAEAITVQFPVASGDTVGASVTCDGFLTSADEAIPKDDVMTQSVTIKFTGERVYTPGS